MAAGLAMDALSVAVAIGASLPRLTARHLFRLSWHFGLFQFLMPVCGYMMTQAAAGYMADWGRWVAFSLLTVVGCRIIRGTANTAPAVEKARDPTRGISLVALSVATSLDALAVGISLAAIGVRILYPSLVIGLVAGAFTLAGMAAGAFLGQAFGRRAGLLGGVVLIGVAVAIIMG